MWCISGLGRLMLQILEAILWPRGLPRANMSRQHEKSWFRSLTSHVFVRATCQPRVDIDMGSAESSLTSHTFARTSCRPEPERCRFLVDVAQKSSKKFCRSGGDGRRWWQVGIGRRCDGGWALLRRMQKLSEFVKVVSSRPAPFGGGGLTIPSGITAAPSNFAYRFVVIKKHVVVILGPAACGL